jgi:hypothetical protein
MAIRRLRLFLLLLAALAVASMGRAADLTPVKGEVLKIGDVVSVSAKEIVFKDGDKNITRPMKDVLKIDLRDLGFLDEKKVRTDVELTDGTIFRCKKWSIKGKEALLTLLVGTEVKVPLGVIANVLNNANVPRYHNDWPSRLAAKRGKEVLVIAVDGLPQNIECTLGDGDKDGKAIEYAITIGEKTTLAKREFDKLHGLIFKNRLDSKAPPVICRVLDTASDVVMVSKVGLKGGVVSVTTPAGVSFDLNQNVVSRLDFSKGRLEYLSDLTPAKVEISSTAEDDDKAVQQHVYKDVSLGKEDRTPIVVGGKLFKKGLAIRPYTKLTYDLKGDYREFSARIGLDDNVGAAGKVTLVISGNGKELQTLTFSAVDKKKFSDVVLNIKDVEKLTIEVKSGDLLDLGKHVDLADAKVSK